MTVRQGQAFRFYKALKCVMPEKWARRLAMTGNSREWSSYLKRFISGCARQGWVRK